MVPFDTFATYNGRYFSGDYRSPNMVPVHVEYDNMSARVVVTLKSTGREISRYTVVPWGNKLFEEVRIGDDYQ